MRQGPKAVRQQARDGSKNSYKSLLKPGKKREDAGILLSSLSGNAQVEARERACRWLKDERLVAKTAKFRFQLADWDRSGTIDRSQVVDQRFSLF